MKEALAAYLDVADGKRVGAESLRAARVLAEEIALDVAARQIKEEALDHYVTHLHRAIEAMPVYGRDDRRFKERVLSLIGPPTTSEGPESATAGSWPANTPSGASTAAVGSER